LSASSLSSSQPCGDVQASIQAETQAGPSPSFFLNKKQDVGIVAAYCIYRDDQFLRSSLDSVCQYVDAVALLDGRFLDFPELEPDNTEQIISETASRFDRRFGGQEKFGVFKTKPVLEVEKRDLTFQVVRPGNYAFILDGDEICGGDVKAGLDFVRSKAEDGIKLFWVYLEEDPGNPGWKPRIIRVEEGLHYGKNHWTILDKENNLLTDSVYDSDRKDFAKISHFKIYNFGPKRHSERRKQVIAYRELLGGKNWMSGTQLEGDSVNGRKEEQTREICRRSPSNSRRTWKQIRSNPCDVSCSPLLD
jgi:hypothetical protein